MFGWLKDGACRSTKLQMPRQTKSPTALPSYASDTIDGDGPALKMPGLLHLYQPQTDDEAGSAMAHRWVRHSDYS